MRAWFGFYEQPATTPTRQTYVLLRFISGLLATGLPQAAIDTRRKELFVRVCSR